MFAYIFCFAAGTQEVHKELETTYTEQLADMEHKLNDARREHTKAGTKKKQKKQLIFSMFCYNRSVATIYLKNSK